MCALGVRKCFLNGEFMLLLAIQVTRVTICVACVWRCGLLWVIGNLVVLVCEFAYH